MLKKATINSIANQIRDSRLDEEDKFDIAERILNILCENHHLNRAEFMKNAGFSFRSDSGRQSEG
jgi:hypothetical protein